MMSAVVHTCYAIASICIRMSHGAQQSEFKRKHSALLYSVKPTTELCKAGPVCSVSAHTLNLFVWAGPP